MLLDAGADPNTETPGCGGGSPPPPPACAPWTAVAGWTALVYACARGAVQTAQLLLARGAKVEGGATLHEDRTTLTPLQVRCYKVFPIIHLKAFQLFVVTTLTCPLNRY